MIIAITLIICLIIQPILGEYISFFNQYEEILIVLLLVGSFYKTIICRKKIYLTKNEIRLLIILIIFLLIGIISAKLSRVQSIDKVILSGILTIKAFICYFLCKICFNFKRIKKQTLNRFYKLINIITLIYFIVLMINIPFKFLKTYGQRMGINTVAMGFTHPAQLDFFLISISIIFLFLTVVLNKDKKVLFMTVIMSFILILFTGRSKAIVFFIAFYLLVFLVFKRGKITVNQILFISPIGFYFAYDRLISEFFSKTGPRGILLRTANKLSKDYFPLGVGFGGFGSHISRKYYSDIYYRYGLSSIYGFSNLNPKYITDSQWATILGECGILGMLTYIIILLVLTICFWNTSNEIIYKLTISGLWIYGIISSISDTIFMGYRGVAIICITIFMSSILKSSDKLSDEKFGRE